MQNDSHAVAERQDPPEVAELPNRFIDTSVGWYVLTRERADLGPYVSLSEAKSALSRHLKQHQSVTSRSPYASFSGFDVHDPQTCHKINCGRCAEAALLEERMTSGW
ncbi:MAG: hypothetical protein R3175_10770 [Marinobacter sp.]|uniref:hypothetical protein n=1 Tax=Marinobacter sp. TaxID=50741 RepID=UPI00299DB12D|nr:hypothetical protein [Marinobacter sp.]MDX1756533.1 hypothetical protein [Marinobacter sp.]